MRTKLEITFISISFIFTALLFILFGSLFVIITPADFINSVLSYEMLYALQLTILTSLISTVLVMIFAIPTAYALSRYSFPLKSIIKSILSMPIAVSEIVIGIALLMLLGNTLLGGPLQKLGINIIFTTTGIIIAQFFVAIPFAIRILYSIFNYVHPRYEFVSRSLGYSEFETLKNVTFPIARNGILAASIVTLARCIGTFAAVLFVAGGTYLKTETLTIALYLNLSYGNINMAVTAGILLVIISFIAVFVLEKYVKETYE
jgi:molybdate transport system permease protein